MDFTFHNQARISIRLIRPYKNVFFFLILVSFLASIFDGISASMLVPILVSLQSGMDYEKLPKILQVTAKLVSTFPVGQQILFSIGVIIVAVLVKNMLLGVSIYLGTGMSSRIMADLRSEAIEMLMGVGIAFYSKSEMGDLADRILNHTTRMQRVVIQLGDFMTNLASFIILFAFLIILSWELTLLSVLFSLVIAAAVSIYLRLLSGVAKTSADANRDLATALYESISGIRLIKTYSKERIQASSLKEKIEKFSRTNHYVNFGNYLVHIITECLGIVAIGAIFLIAMRIYHTGSSLLIPRLIPFVYVLTRILPTLKVLYQTKSIIVSELPFASSLDDLLRRDNKPFIRDGDESFPGLRREIEFKSVTFFYNDEATPALVDTNFSIPAGKTTAIVGESGSGKSTIVDLLLRFYDPQEGTILIDGRPLRIFRLDSYRRKVGVVAQETFIFNDTVANNISFGAAEPERIDLVQEAAKKSGVHEFAKDLSEGYDTFLGDRGIKLSGGQRQRISIARAILKDPEILILDEATSSLDSRSEQLIHQAITDLARNRTVIIIAHRFSTIKKADQIIVLKHGRVIEMGNEHQLLHNKGEYYRLTQASVS